MTFEKFIPNFPDLYRNRFFQADRSRDAFLASFPRSGNTWMRTILFHSLHTREPVNLSEIDFGIPDIHHKLPRRKIMKSINNKFQHRHIVKTHEPYNWQTEYRNAVYIVRDPRDVIPSYYRYVCRKMSSSELNFEDFAVACIKGAIWPCSWFDHAMSWKYFHDTAQDSVCLVQYEKLKNLNGVEIERFGHALGVPDIPELVLLFKYYDIDRMKKLEALGNRPNESAPGFIGTGYAPAEQAETVDRAIRHHAPHWYDLMSEFGYNT